MTHHQSASCRFSISYRLKIMCDLELRASRISPIELPCPCTRSLDQAQVQGQSHNYPNTTKLRNPHSLDPLQNHKSQFMYPHFLLPAPWTRSPQASKAQPPPRGKGEGRTHIVILAPRPRQQVLAVGVGKKRVQAAVGSDCEVGVKEGEEACKPRCVLLWRRVSAGT
jgi:hypothetical protein